MNTAHALMEKKLEMKNLLVAHALDKFREFVEKNREMLGEPAASDILKLDDVQLGELMHSMKCAQPYLGQAFQDSRNFFRWKHLEESLSKTSPGNLDLEKYIEHKGDYPTCSGCQYFKTPPTGEKFGCVHLVPTQENPNQNPALPLDIACMGWKPLQEDSKLSG